MKKPSRSYLELFETFVSRFAFQILFILVVANIGLFYAASYISRAQTCFTTAQVTSDNRCLYIWSGKVFEKDTRTNPHKGHPCGMDVTSIIPGFHLADMAKYMDPTYKGNICTSQPTATPTRPVPTNTPVPSATRTPTVQPSPTRIPTNTPVPPSATSRPTPTRTPSPLPTNTSIPTRTPSPTKTPTPPPVGDGPSNTPAPTATMTRTPTPTRVASPTQTSTYSPTPSHIPTPTQESGYYGQIATLTPLPTEANALSCPVPFRVQNVRIECPVCQQAP